MHTFEICESNKVNSRAFKDELLALIVELYNALPNRNYPIICRCYFYLDNTKAISQILWNLINNDGNSSASVASNANANDNDNDNDVNMDNNNNTAMNTTETNTSLDSHERELICYQICFDLFEFQNESFTRAIFDNIPKPPTSQLYPQRAIAEAQRKAEQAAMQGIANDANATGDNQAAASQIAPAGNAAPAETSVPTQEAPQQEEERWSDELLARWKSVRSILLGMFYVLSCFGCFCFCLELWLFG